MNSGISQTFHYFIDYRNVLSLYFGIEDDTYLLCKVLMQLSF